MILEQEYRTRILQGYVHVVTLRDIVERDEISNVDALRTLIRSLLTSSASLFSVNKLSENSIYYLRYFKGYLPQDCERRGFFRFLVVLKRSGLKLPFTLLGDGLFADQPVVEAIHKHGFNFMITSKPNDNIFLHEEFSLVTIKKHHFEYRDDKYLHIYSWSNQLSFNGKRQVQVNLVHYEMKKEKKPDEYEIVYKNSWVTDHEITEENVKDIVKAGRTRWHIKNQCFNNLKNHGYHLEHSYGHGERFLSFNFIILTMLAFYMHQFLEYRDELFKACRKKLESKRYLEEKLRSYITLLVFNSFEWLLEFVLNRDHYVGEHGLQLSRGGPVRSSI